MKQSEFIQKRAEAELKAEPILRYIRQSLIDMYMRGLLDGMDACYDESAAEKKLAEEEEALRELEENGPSVKLKPDAILKRKIIYGKDLSIRASKALKMNNIDTVGDLIKHTKRDLLKMQGFGKKSLREVEEFVERLNILKT